MPDLSIFPHYHPAWQGQKFTVDQYSRLLGALSNKKEGESFFADGKSIAVVGRIGKFLQTLKGWLGFENYTEPMKVNYELLKLLQYGETQHFFTRDGIKSLVGNLRKTLIDDQVKAFGDQKQSYDAITTLITGILDTSDEVEAAKLTERTITAFREQNEEKLQPARWSNLFRKRLLFAEEDAAKLHLNEADILLSLGKFSEAIPVLEKALEIAPNNPEGQFKLCALKIREGRYTQAVAALQNLSFEHSILQVYQNFMDKHPELRASVFQESNFMFNLAERSRLPDGDKVALLNLSANMFRHLLGLKQEDSLLIFPLLLKTQLRLSKHYEETGQHTLALSHLKEAGSMLESLRKQAAQSPFFNTNLPDFKAQAELLMNKLHSQQEYRQEVDVLLLLISLYQKKVESGELGDRLMRLMDHVGGMAKAKEYLLMAYKRDSRYAYLLTWADCERKIWAPSSPEQVCVRLMKSAHQQITRKDPFYELSLAIYETAMPLATIKQKRSIILLLTQISKRLEKENIELSRKYSQLADKYMLHIP